MRPFRIILEKINDEMTPFQICITPASDKVTMLAVNHFSRFEDLCEAARQHLHFGDATIAKLADLNKAETFAHRDTLLLTEDDSRALNWLT